MLTLMAETQEGRILLADVIQHELWRLGRPVSDVPGGRSALSRMRRKNADEEPITDMRLARVEGLFGWPRGFARCLLDRDVQAIRSSDADPDLKKWILAQMPKPPGTRRTRAS